MNSQMKDKVGGRVRFELLELAAAARESLLMTAMDRAHALHVPCTLHRRPGAGPPRAVIVCSFEPREENLHLPNVFCQVAALHASGTDNPVRHRGEATWGRQ